MSVKHYREIIALAAPIAGIQFAQVALTSTDLLMMGLLGLEAVAAGGLAMLLYNQLRTMCVGMVTSVGNMVAAAVGRGEKRTGSTAIDDVAIEEVKDLLRAAMLLATVAALVAGAVLVLFGRFLGSLGQAQAVVDLANPIMLALAPGLLPMIWLNVLRQFAVGMRRAGSLLTVTILSIAVNALLNAAFIYGWLGMPKLGLVGIGLSTTLVQIWTFAVYLRTVKRDDKLNGLLALDAWNAKWATVLRIAKMGTPISLTYGSEAAITSIATVLMGTFGPVALAASNIVNQLAYIVYQLNIGLSHGSSILVSRTLGKGDVEEIGSVAARTFTISFGVMALIGMAYILVPEVVLRPFLAQNPDPDVVSLAAVLLWFAIAHQFLKGSQNICIGLLRGLGNTKAGLTNTLIGYWGVGIPCMFACSYLLGWEGYGVWFGLCLGFGVTSLLLWWHFLNALRGTSAKIQSVAM
ncbi:MATE family efflux transporter [Rhizobium helianthi]|uniref:MATE family efflux transporter n=1 Tax=Rhizobium helianthi TaxID=1132695 RepID=A0ABW4M1A6_9HYPH